MSKSPDKYRGVFVTLGEGYELLLRHILTPFPSKKNPTPNKKIKNPKTFFSPKTTKPPLKTKLKNKLWRWILGSLFSDFLGYLL